MKKGANSYQQQSCVCVCLGIAAQGLCVDVSVCIHKVCVYL